MTCPDILQSHLFFIRDASARAVAFQAHSRMKGLWSLSWGAVTKVLPLALTHSAGILLHLCVQSLVFFLIVDQSLPLGVRVASYWSESAQYNTQFNTVAFLLSPFPFDLHSRKRSLYFDFYIRYLIQLLFCFAFPLFSPPFGLSTLLCLTFPFSHWRLTVTSLCTLSWRVSLISVWLWLSVVLLWRFA